MIFTPDLVRLLAPGFERVPGKFELAVQLTRIMFPFLLLVALAAQAMGVLNACGRFGVPALASTAFNIGSVAFGLLFGFTAARWIGVGMVQAMAWGACSAAPCNCSGRCRAWCGEGFGFRPLVDLSHPGLRRIFSLMGPAILGNAAVQINVMVNTNFASSITDAAGHVINGPVSWLGYAFRFMQLPLGVFGVAIASATLPAISRSAAVGRMDEFRATLARSLGMVLLLTMPSSVGLAVLGESMIGAVYQWGRFQAPDTRQTALALSCYAVGLAGYSAIKILAPAFYALNDGRTPMMVSVASIVVNFVVASIMVGPAGLGHAGLALSTSVVAIFGSRHPAGRAAAAASGGIGGSALYATVCKVTAASVVMGAACWASSRGVHAWLGTGKSAQLADVAISIPLGAAVFCGAARALRTPELEAVAAALGGPLTRLFRR